VLAVDASVWLPSAALVLVALITAWGQSRTRSGLKDVSQGIQEVHQEVRTGNDKTAGQLSVITRGRQIDADIPAGEQSSDQKHYVEQYLEGRHTDDKDRNRGLTDH
jgi:hypothetical protein